jgi:hypothetical protein
MFVLEPVMVKSSVFEYKMAMQMTDTRFFRTQPGSPSRSSHAHAGCSHLPRRQSPPSNPPPPPPSLLRLL